MTIDFNGIIVDAQRRGQLTGVDHSDYVASLMSGPSIDANDLTSINFVGRSVSFDDIYKSAQLDLLGNSNVYAAMRFGGFALVAAAPIVGKILGAAAYLGAEGFALASSALKSRDNIEFWNEYYSKMNTAGQGNKFTQGYVTGGNLFMGSSMAQQTGSDESLSFTAGNILGFLARDITIGMLGANMATALSPKIGRIKRLQQTIENVDDALKPELIQKMASLQGSLEAGSELGFKVAMVGGSAASNALNRYATERGNGSDTVTAIRNAFAIGGASLISGAASFAFVDKMFNKLIPTVLTPQTGRPLQFGLEMGGWAAGEDFMETTIKRSLGDENAQMTIDPFTISIMMAGGFIAGKAAGSLGKFVKGIVKKRLGTEAIENAENEIVDSIKQTNAQPDAQGLPVSNVSDGADILTSSKNILEGDANASARSIFNNIVNKNRDGSGLLNIIRQDQLRTENLLDKVRRNSTNKRKFIEAEVDDFIKREKINADKTLRDKIVDQEMKNFEDSVARNYENRTRIIEDTSLVYNRLWSERQVDLDKMMTSPFSKEEEGVVKDIVVRVIHEGASQTTDIAEEVFKKLPEAYRTPDNIAIIMKEIYNQRGLL